jgi:hypothetical protein
MFPRLATVLPLLLLAGAAPLGTGCAAGTPASNLAKAPAYEPAGQTKCQIAASKREPLIVEWPSAARGKLEALSKHGLVAVSYSGCEMEVLSACKVSGSYAYTAITRKHDHVTVRDADDLYAKIPLGAVSLEGTLQRTGQLDVSMTIVGRLESDRSEFADLRGTDCERATHVVSALTLGAFDFSAGSDAEVGGGAKLGNAGAGASSRSSRELLNSDGEEARCQGATAADSRPPDGCGAIVRVEVTPIRRGSSQAKVSPPTEPGGAPGLEVQPRPIASLPASSRLGQGESVKIETAESGLTFQVSVEASDGVHACDAPVTESQSCTVGGLPAGGARLHVTGDAVESKNFTLTGEGTSTIKIVHHTHAAAWVLGALGVAGLVVGGIGIAQESSQLNSISSGNTNTLVTPDLLAGFGISAAVVGAYGLFVALKVPSYTFTIDSLGTPTHDLAIGPSATPGGGMMKATLTF